jgi:dTMP kinase
MTAPARFITLEGGEGTGKTTQARLLIEALTRRGLPVLQTREPGGAPGAELLPEILLNGTIDWSAPAEAMLHFAARAEHVERTIRPALAAGTWVICDRFADSTMAYQGYGQGADPEMIAALTRLIGLRPDLTLVLDLPPGLAARRLRARGDAPDRYDRLGDAFHARVAEGFRRIAAADPDRCILIDASRSEGAVHGLILNVVERRFLQA